MKDALIYVLFLALWIGVPVAGLVAAVLVANRPLRSVSRWWSVTYAALATALSTVWMVTNWSPSPEDTLYNGIHLAAMALAGGALVTSFLLWRLPPHGRAFSLVRDLAAATCFFSALAWVLVVFAGGVEG